MVTHDGDDSNDSIGLVIFADTFDTKNGLLSGQNFSQVFANAIEFINFAYSRSLSLSVWRCDSYDIGKEN